MLLFSNYKERVRKAICQLRNTFAHNFGLATERKLGQHFHFALSFNPSAQLVEFPAQEWDNDFSGKSDENCTVIGLVALCNMVEQTVKNVFAAHKAKKLKFNCGDTEILTRFSLCMEG